MPDLKPDYYRVLGVSKTVTKAGLKKAYHALARKFHPDVSDRPDAEAHFKLINEAYQVLSNDLRRTEYDHAAQQRHQNGRAGFRDYTTGFFDGFTLRTDQCTYEPLERVCYFRCPHCGDETWVFFSDVIIRWENLVRPCEMCARPVIIEYKVKRNRVVTFEARVLS